MIQSIPMLGEISDDREYGRLEIIGERDTPEREYIEGMYWGGGVFSREMIMTRARSHPLEDAAILLLTWN
jgi:hypothetical protein